MRIIESAGFYYPDSSGGTEVYVNFLAKELQAQGVECAVAAPSPSEETSRYIHEGTEVFRYPVPGRLLRSEIQGGRRPASLANSWSGCGRVGQTFTISIPGRPAAASGTSRQQRGSDSRLS